MRLRYVGTSFQDGLTNGREYEGKEVNAFCFLVQDDSGAERMYSRSNPRPCTGKCNGGRWDIVL
ncbi:hypothetical protein HW273_00755 [Oribacterium sp. oral taxon 102]|uniref:hypothetical protein n=1 Tax=Oribacterium sp. oral taxon 102 TaxID=671214 RepID=UPI0015BBF21C|nr:hypothetical protein [Oribacterium sp. oral taxon 102]NWO20454.1 hypothetical protein [Oribacterium sp. oral taxon 102]